MILLAGDQRREKYLKDGNILFKIRNTGGGGKGCAAGGVVFLVFAVFIMVLMALIGLRTEGILIFGGILALPGILMVILGSVLHKRKMKNYLDYYQKETGFELEELKQLERELMEPDMMMIGNIPDDPDLRSHIRASEKNPQIACMMTKDHFVMPMIAGKCYIRRVSDMFLATYSTGIPGINGYKHGLVFLSRKDDDPYINAFLSRDACAEVINGLCIRNPELITKQKFMYEGKEYDVIMDGKEIAKIIGA